MEILDKMQKGLSRGHLHVRNETFFKSLWENDCKYALLQIESMSEILHKLIEKIQYYANFSKLSSWFSDLSTSPKN